MYGFVWTRSQRALSDRQEKDCKMQTHFGSVAGKTLAVWGLAFKPNTDDMREAPSRVLIDALLAAGAKVQAYDPVAMPECEKLYTGKAGIRFVKNFFVGDTG